MANASIFDQENKSTRQLRENPKPYINMRTKANIWSAHKEMKTNTFITRLGW